MEEFEYGLAKAKKIGFDGERFLIGNRPFSFEEVKNSLGINAPYFDNVISSLTIAKDYFSEKLKRYATDD